MKLPTPFSAALAALACAALLAACGGGDDEEALDAPTLEQWQARADQFCSDGVQEAIALPLPTTGREVGQDAAAMAEIVLVAEDGISPLPPPADSEAQALIASYLGELTADANILARISDAAIAGEDYLVPLAELDESAGQVALELGLEQCAAFSNAVARTP